MKYVRLRVVVIGAMFGAALVARAAAPPKATLLIVPREDVPMRVGLDVGSRHPTILLSYQITPSGTVVLNGWTGNDWVGVSPQSFESGTFFKTAPEYAVIVADSRKNVPSSLIPSVEWCPWVYSISSTELRPMLHLIGRHYDFSYKDWQWFSTNYRMHMESINPEGLNVAWYHRSLKDNIGDSTSVADSDLQYFSVIRRPEPVEEPFLMEEPEITEEPPISVEEETEDSLSAEAEMQGDAEEVDPEENPFVKEAPAAVILESEEGDGSMEPAQDAGMDDPEEP